MILTVTPNPCVDKTVFIDTLEPGAFIRAPRYTTIPGGKGTNVSRAVKALGGETKAMVLVGGHTGRHVVDMIEQQDGVTAVPVWVEAATRTITTALEEPTGRQTALFEPGPAVTDVEAQQFVDTFAANLDGVELVTLCGSVPDSTLNTAYLDMIRAAREREIPVILDSYGEVFNIGLGGCPRMVKPNVAETEKTWGFKLDGDDAVQRAIDRFHMKGIETVVLSLGAEGALVSSRDELLRITPPAIREVNPVGSGDALVGAFALGLLRGDALETCAVQGVAAGTANAMSWDIGHFDRNQVAAIAKEVTVHRLR